MGMAYVLSVGTSIPKYHVSQETAADFARGMFADSFKDIDRLLKAFQNGEIESRQFVRPIEWYKTARGFSEKTGCIRKKPSSTVRMRHLIV